MFDMAEIDVPANRSDSDNVVIITSPIGAFVAGTPITHHGCRLPACNCSDLRGDISRSLVSKGSAKSLYILFAARIQFLDELTLVSNARNYFLQGPRGTDAWAPCLFRQLHAIAERQRQDIEYYNGFPFY
jgi:hypothetical protein